ncbi:substrate-binding periplasmic protein [Glaciimonas soli]|uniref:Transporter substrate-binding domain-containing protein n=1 Tax=Glaciimonas soli TaxID=2590999 RepID=A0A843YXZ3_9BURK|nr:transporter substrate-binding domain-containing protein [Glaciimonas soli]MQR02643.1 transporter substrate-binding domain-containing protein [Glaciimonas soli]
MINRLYLSAQRCLLHLLLLLLSGSACCQTTVIYPSSASSIDIRHNDLIELLSTSLEKTKREYGAYSVGPSKLKMNEARSLVELKRGDSVTVVWSPTSEELEKKYIAIRIPLRKGLLGLRISLIDKKKQSSLERVNTITDLKKLSLGMGIGWVDLSVLKANEINVVTAHYDALFTMTAHDRFDLFPRGINEVFNEYDQRRQIYPNLAVEQNLLIYYPWPYYFFVNKNNPQLAERIRLGLERMIDDGTFNRIFMKYNGEAIRRANLSHRHIIQLKNPFLPRQTPTDARYWLFPSLIKSDVIKQTLH